MSAYAVKKAGVPFRVKLKTNASCTGKADSFSGYYVEDLTETKTDITGDYTELSDAPGVFMSPQITIDTENDYTFIFNNDDINMVNHAAPVVITSATLSDVKSAVDAIQSDVTTVLANIADLKTDDDSSVDDLKAEIKAVRELIQSSSAVSYEVSGDQTGSVAVDDTVTGETSGATGTVSAVTYDADSDTTKITVKSVEGTFEEGENISGLAASNITDLLDSVKEFVEVIYASMNGASGSSDLINKIVEYTDNVENMLLGSEFLQDGTTENPLYGKSILSIYNKLTEALDGGVTDSLMEKVDVLKATVTATSDLLNDDTNGLAAIKSAIDTMADGKTLSDIATEILTGTGGISDLKTMIESRFDSVDSALSDIDDRIANGSSFEVFA